MVLLEQDYRFLVANPGAEQFFGISAAQLAHLRLSELVPADNPIFLLMDTVRRAEVTIADYDLTIESPRLHKQGITVQCTPLPEEPGSVVLVLQDVSTARSLDRRLRFRGAAR